MIPCSNYCFYFFCIFMLWLMNLYCAIVAICLAFSVCVWSLLFKLWTWSLISIDRNCLFVFLNDGSFSWRLFIVDSFPLHSFCPHLFLSVINVELWVPPLLIDVIWGSSCSHENGPRLLFRFFIVGFLRCCLTALTEIELCSYCYWRGIEHRLYDEHPRYYWSWRDMARSIC